MTNKDYYKILGLSEKATAAEIKKAYRRLAKKYHPDSHPGDSAAEARFKELAEAYAVLSDDKKRQEYDQFKQYGFFAGREGGSGRRGGFNWQTRDFSGFDFANDFSLGDFFSQFFDRGGTSTGSRSARRGQDVHADLQIPFEVAALGGRQSLRMDINGQAKTLSLNIKPGTDDGQKIRLSGQGAGGPGLESGDLILTIHVAPRPGFRREKRDIIAVVELNLAQALLGTKLMIQTLEGKNVQVKVAAGTQNGDRVRLKGLGIKTPEAQGDYYLEFKVAIPRNLNQSEKEIIREFAHKRKLSY